MYIYIYYCVVNIPKDQLNISVVNYRGEKVNICLDVDVDDDGQESSKVICGNQGNDGKDGKDGQQKIDMLERRQRRGKTL